MHTDSELFRKVFRDYAQPDDETAHTMTVNVCFVFCNMCAISSAAS